MDASDPTDPRWPRASVLDTSTDAAGNVYGLLELPDDVAPRVRASVMEKWTSAARPVDQAPRYPAAPPALDPANVRAAVSAAVGGPRSPVAELAGATVTAADRACRQHEQELLQRMVTDQLERAMGMHVVVDEHVPEGYGLVRNAQGVVTQAVQYDPTVRVLGRDTLVRAAAHAHADVTGEPVLLIGPGRREIIRPGEGPGS